MTFEDFISANGTGGWLFGSEGLKHYTNGVDDSSTFLGLDTCVGSDGYDAWVGQTLLFIPGVDTRLNGHFYNGTLYYPNQQPSGGYYQGIFYDYGVGENRCMSPYGGWVSDGYNGQYYTDGIADNSFTGSAYDEGTGDTRAFAGGYWISGETRNSAYYTNGLVDTSFTGVTYDDIVGVNNLFVSGYATANPAGWYGTLYYAGLNTGYSGVYYDYGLEDSRFFYNGYILSGGYQGQYYIGGVNSIFTGFASDYYFDSTGVTQYYFVNGIKTIPPINISVGNSVSPSILISYKLGVLPLLQQTSKNIQNFFIAQQTNLPLMLKSQVSLNPGLFGQMYSGSGDSFSSGDYADDPNFFSVRSDYKTLTAAKTELYNFSINTENNIQNLLVYGLTANNGQPGYTASINNVQTNYSWEFKGYFKAPYTDYFTLSTWSDDASYLWIGPNALNGYTTSNADVQNGGPHGTVGRASSPILLQREKFYPIRIQYGQGNGGANLSFLFSSSTETDTSNMNNILYYKSANDVAFS